MERRSPVPQILQNSILHVEITCYCGWLRNPAPVDTGRWFIRLSMFIPLSIRFQPSKAVQDFFHVMLCPDFVAESST